MSECGPLIPISCGSWVQKKGNPNRYFIMYAEGDWDDRVIALRPEMKRGPDITVPMADFGKHWEIVGGNPTGTLVGAYNEEVRE